MGDSGQKEDLTRLLPPSLEVEAVGGARSTPLSMLVKQAKRLTQSREELRNTLGVMLARENSLLKMFK